MGTTPKPHINDADYLAIVWGFYLKVPFIGWILTDLLNKQGRQFGHRSGAIDVLGFDNELWGQRSKSRALSKELDIFKDIHFGSCFVGVQNFNLDLKGQGHFWLWRSKVIWQESSVFELRTWPMFGGLSYLDFY